MTDNKAYIIIDVGGTFLKSAIMESSGSILESSMSMDRACSECSKEQIVCSLVDIIDKKRLSIKECGHILGGVGLTFPGPFNYAQGKPLMTHKYSELYGLNLAGMLRSSLGLSEEIPLIFRHDANSVLEGEIWKGAASDFNNSALITLGTGLGFACAFDKKVMTNEIGGPFITIFKLPYKDSILEDYASRRGFLKIYGMLCGNHLPADFDVLDIAMLADKGDSDALETFSTVGAIIASAVKQILIENKIECLLFAGQISQSFRFMERTIKDTLKDVACLRRISQAESIETAALSGVMKELADRRM
jgi:glucokinase